MANSSFLVHYAKKKSSSTQRLDQEQHKESTRLIIETANEIANPFWRNLCSNRIRIGKGIGIDTRKEWTYIHPVKPYFSATLYITNSLQTLPNSFSSPIAKVRAHEDRIVVKTRKPIADPTRSVDILKTLNIMDCKLELLKDTE